MGRKLTKPRPKQGARLAQLRKAAGLSQYDLARIVGESQANIAFGERSHKPPRSDLLPLLAKVLRVSIEDLIDSNSVKKIYKSKRGPTGKVRKLFEQLSILPRNQQDLIVDFLSFFIKRFQQSKHR